MRVVTVSCIIFMFFNCRRRLDKTLSLKEALLKILRYQEIIGLIYKIEQEEVISTDKLFTEVTSYTREDLKGYEIRMVFKLYFQILSV